VQGRFQEAGIVSSTKGRDSSQLKSSKQGEGAPVNTAMKRRGKGEKEKMGVETSANGGASHEPGKGSEKTN